MILSLGMVQAIVRRSKKKKKMGCNGNGIINASNGRNQDYLATLERISTLAFNSSGVNLSGW